MPRGPARQSAAADSPGFAGDDGRRRPAPVGIGQKDAAIGFGSAARDEQIAGL
jgi:hypothetical protein